MKMKSHVSCLTILASCIALCGPAEVKADLPPVAGQGVSRTDVLRSILASDDTNYVFVALHQGDHERHRGNSLESIAGSIEMGADIVEIDVRKTADGRFVLSHDQPKEPAPTSLPTFEEAIRLTRGKILVNIDKFDAAPVDILREVERLGVRDQVLVKLLHVEPSVVKNIFGESWRHVESGELLYMPVVQFCWGRHRRAAEILPILLAAEPRRMSMYEICIDKMADVGRIGEIRESAGRPRIWMNAMWDDLAAGHGEAPPPRLAKGRPRRPIDPDACWGWILAQGATVIQTDNGRALLRYLDRHHRRHPLTCQSLSPQFAGDGKSRGSGR